MDARAIIAQVRKGQTPPQADLSAFAQGLATGLEQGLAQELGGASAVAWAQVTARASAVVLE